MNMNLLREHFMVKKMMKRLKRKNKGTNIHHREAVKNGGTDKPDNLIRVNKKAHAAYHGLFGTKTPLQIVQDLNRRWLPLRVTVITIPTDRLTEVLALLSVHNVLDAVDLQSFGVTPEHLQYYGTREERQKYTEQHLGENMKRPE